MACNVVRALEDPGNDMMIFKHGLGYAKWGDCLDYDDWCLLNYAPDMKTLKKIICDLLNKYITLGMILDNPQTSEEWYNRMYGNFLKTRKKSRFFKVLHQKYAGTMYENPYYTMDYEKQIGIAKQ